MGLEIKILAALALVAAILFGFSRFVASERAAGAAVCEDAHAKADRIEGDRRAAAAREADSEAQRMLVRRRDEAVSLDAAAERLRQRSATAVRTVVDSTPANCREAASEAARVPTELQGWLEQRLRLTVDEADISHDEGLGCEQRYDSLTR